MVGRVPSGFSGDLITSGSATVTPARLSATVRPVTVSARPSSSGPSWLITARVPPASSKSSIGVSPLGLTAVSSGTPSASVSNIRYTSAPHSASAATACRCLTELIDPLTDKIAVTAFLNAAGVMMSRGLRSSATICTILAPAASTAAHIGSLLARTGVEPGSAMPSASQARCIVFAVPIPAHTPGDSTALALISVSSSTPSRPLATCPAARNTSSMSQCLPR